MIRRNGDHLLAVLQNRWEMATLHWACQFAGIVITPLNWRKIAALEGMEAGTPLSSGMAATAMTLLALTAAYGLGCALTLPTDAFLRPWIDVLGALTRA